MGSKKWTSALGTVGLITGGPAGAAIGAGGGKSIDKKSSGGGGAAIATTQEDDEKQKAAGEGGTSPFDEGALGVSAKKRKLNTLVGGYYSGALSGSGEGSMSLG